MSVDDDLSDAPPRTKLIYLALKQAGPLSHVELMEYTAMADHSVRRGLEDLQERDVVDAKLRVGDARGEEYHLVD